MPPEGWNVDWCQGCRAANWVYSGDPEDLTLPDIDGWVCWSCDEIHHVNDDFDPSERAGVFAQGFQSPTQAEQR